MRLKSRRTLRVVLLGAAAALCLPSGVRAQSGAAKNLALRVGIDQKLGSSIPLETPFLSETGQAVSLSEVISERPVVMALVYYECPMLCGLVLDGLLSNLKLVGLKVGDDFDIVTVSIDPGETPTVAAARKAELIAKYGFQSAGLGEGWHPLTGSQASIDRLAEAVGFRYVYDPATDEYAHGAAIMVVTPEGTISRYFYGIEYPPRDLRLGLVEAAGNRIGTLADQVLLLCYRYDAVTGRYDFAIWAAIRIAGMATLLGLVGFILVSLRRERSLAGAPTASGGQR